MNNQQKTLVSAAMATLNFMSASTIAHTGNTRRAIMSATRCYNKSHDLYGCSKGMMPASEVNQDFLQSCLEHANSDSNKFGKE